MHHVVLKISLIIFHITKSVFSQAIFLPINEHTHISMVIGVVFLSIAIGNAADSDSFEYGFIRQLKLAVYLMKLLQVFYPWW